MSVGDKVMKTAFDNDMVWTCLTILFIFQFVSFLDVTHVFFSIGYC